jgi:hypothetical protein
MLKLYNIFRVLSIAAYFLIMLNGEMISIPFIFFLFFSICDFGTKAQAASVLAFIGLILLITLIGREKTKRTLLIEIVVLILLLLPILERLTSVPISLFNYPAFIIPVVSFIILYLLSMLLPLLQQR